LTRPAAVRISAPSRGTRIEWLLTSRPRSAPVRPSGARRERRPPQPDARLDQEGRGAIAAGDKKAALAALRAAQPEIQRGGVSRVIAKNAAARRVSRLNARIKAMA